MIGIWRTASLIAATVTMGLVTGALALYSHAIMPGLADTDDRTFIAAFQEIDRSIINPWFMAGGFVGALVFTAIAAALQLRRARAVLPWVIAALVLYLVAFLITTGVHVPANDELKAAGDPDQLADPAAVRARFDESRWTRWNHVRALASTAAFGCLAWALAQHGRTSRVGARST